MNKQEAINNLLNELKQAMDDYEFISARTSVPLNLPDSLGAVLVVCRALIDALDTKE